MHLSVLDLISQSIRRFRFLLLYILRFPFPGNYWYNNVARANRGHCCIVVVLLIVWEMFPARERHAWRTHLICGHVTHFRYPVRCPGSSFSKFLYSINLKQKNYIKSDIAIHCYTLKINSKKSISIYQMIMIHDVHAPDRSWFSIEFND